MNLKFLLSCSDNRNLDELNNKILIVVIVSYIQNNDLHLAVLKKLHDKAVHRTHRVL
jgi:hypothetical protein